MREETPGKKNADKRPQKPGHYRRYPEEELIDVLEERDGQAVRAGEELAEHLRAVTGRADGSTGKD